MPQSHKDGQSGGGRGPKKPPLTHFLCIPLVNDVSRPQLMEALSTFQNMVTEVNETNSKIDSNPPWIPIPAKAMRPIGTIHFTLGVMSLETEDMLQQAIDLLYGLDYEGIREEIQNDGSRHLPATINLESLHSMHPPLRTSILYAGPSDDSGILVDFGTKICEQFRAAGLMVPDDRALKLHATVLNTIYAKTGGRSGGSRAPPRINAKALLEKCEGFAWAGGLPLEKLAICKMGATKIKDESGAVLDEQYEEVASVPWPASEPDATPDTTTSG